jgi:hypothetical protein
VYVPACLWRAPEIRSEILAFRTRRMSVAVEAT